MDFDITLVGVVHRARESASFTAQTLYWRSALHFKEHGFIFLCRRVICGVIDIEEGTIDHIHDFAWRPVDQKSHDVE